MESDALGASCLPQPTPSYNLPAAAYNSLHIAYHCLEKSILVVVQYELQQNITDSPMADAASKIVSTDVVNTRGT